MFIRFTPPEGQAPLSPLLKLILEMGPLVVFFIANNKFDLFVATAAFMVTMAASLIIHYIIAKHLPIMPLVSGLVVFVFGGLTLYLQDELFIKIKPTIVNVMFGVILLGGYMFKRYFLQTLLSSALSLTEEGWRKLTLNWGVFFLFLAVLNEFIWRSYSTDFWVSFKTFGVMPITIIFSLAQLPIIQRYMIETKDKS